MEVAFVITICSLLMYVLFDLMFDFIIFNFFRRLLTRTRIIEYKDKYYVQSLTAKGWRFRTEFGLTDDISESVSHTYLSDARSSVKRYKVVG